MVNLLKEYEILFGNYFLKHFFLSKKIEKHI